MSGVDGVYVGLAGGAGAVLRLILDGVVRARLETAFPAGTVAINTSGSFVLGLVAGLVSFHAAPGTLSLVVGTGFCGGYTTFSTASFESVRLLQQGRARLGALNLVASVGGSLGAAALGLLLAYA